MSEHLVEDLNGLFAEALHERDKARAQCVAIRVAALDVLTVAEPYENEVLGQVFLSVNGSSLVALRAALDCGETG
jgi:hypothetical protein